MRRHNKEYYLMIILSGVFLGVSFILSCMGKRNVCIEFIIIMLTFSLSILIRELGSQYMSLKQYSLLGTLALSDVFKMTLIILEFHYFIIDGHWNIEIWKLLVQCSALEVVGIVLGYFLAMKEVNFQITSNIVPLVYLLIMLGGACIETSLVERVLSYILCLGVIAVGVIATVEKVSLQNILNERIPYFRGRLSLVFIQYLMQYFLYRAWQQYSLFFISFEFLKVTYLFQCTVYTCLRLPWQQRMYAMNEADKKLDRQSRNCDMIVSLSHELKTPVNVIRSALDILVLDVENTMKEEVRDIKRECNRVMNIIQDMIDIQKINTHHIEINKQRYNLVELFENVIDTFADEVKECRLIFNPQEEEIDEVVDGLLMQQCFMLLIGLLIQYDHTEEIYIELEQNIKENKIYIKIVSLNTKYLRNLEELEHEMADGKEIEEQVAQLLTLRLVNTLLKVQDATSYFEENNLLIVFKMNREGKRVWIDERNIAILNDQVRCRYIEG